MRVRLTHGADAIAILVCAITVAASAAPVGDDPLFRGEPGLAKVSRSLLDNRHRRTVADPAPGFRTVDGMPELDIRFSRLTPEIVEQALATGLRVLDVDLRYARILGVCPGDCLAALAKIPELTAIHPNYGAFTMTGDVLSQADESLRAAAARQSFQVSGDGVRIGMISDTLSDKIAGNFTGEGCDRKFTSTHARSAAELPEFVRVVAEPDDLPGISFSGIDEGRAMAELIYDLAPGADLYFHTAFTTPTIFARGIDALVDCGVDIIVDDVIYFAEPMFQDGIVAQAAADAVAADVIFFSAIGNLGTAGVDELYRDFDANHDDMEDTPSGDDLHVFANGTRFAPVTIPRGCGLRMVLQWNEPFSGALGAGASSDLDLYACPGDNPLTCQSSAGARDAQGCASGSEGPLGDPIEILDINSFGSADRTFHIAVEHVCGNKNLRFRIVSFSLGSGSCNFPSRYGFDPLVFNKSQAYGHPTSAGVIGTAAVFYQEIDTAGQRQGDPDQINVEPFSSRGGDIPIYFDHAGSLIPDGPVLRTTPLLAAADGTNTSFFGLRDEEGDGLLNFFGTSAAAPHAAAVAALILEANPDLSAAETLEIMQSTAIDIESAGRDELSGSGLIDALNAVQETLRRLTPGPSATATSVFSATPSATATSVFSATPGATATSRFIATSTASATPDHRCPGDCNGDGRVTVAELITGVRIGLGTTDLGVCSRVDIDRNGTVAIGELIQAVNAGLRGC